MINVRNVDKFKSELACALLGTTVYDPNVVRIQLAENRYVLYNYLTGTTSITTVTDNVVTKEMAAGTLTTHLKYANLEKYPFNDGRTVYDLIKAVLTNNLLFDHDYHYYLIPKDVLTMAFVYKLEWILQDPFVYAGICKRKNACSEFFRDNDDLVRLNKTDEYQFLSVFYGPKAFIFVRTPKSQSCDLMFRLSNPWQFNKYFTVKKIIEGGL